MMTGSRPIIDRFPDRDPVDGDPILWWKNRRGRETRIILALPTFEYVVVMADRGEYVMPWTAYQVEQPHRQRKLQKEYENFWNAHP